jgi:2-polyprenyl-3-methyl-5-hydroxy-6-metoxy-1,4-benzoquinol methylase
MMDQPNLALSAHRAALCGLRRLNVASGVCRQLWRPIGAYARANQLDRVRVLDVASGGGDVPLRLWKLAKRHGVALQVLGLDVSSAACRIAAERCRPSAGAITFQQADVIRDALPTGFDVVTCSLFLHHLSFAEAANLLRRMSVAGRLLVVHDLRRCAGGYALAQLACHLLTTSAVVHCDGPRSVANAFSLTEMRKLCAEAGLTDTRVQPAWPYRLMVIRQGG